MNKPISFAEQVAASNVHTSELQQNLKQYFTGKTALIKLDNRDTIFDFPFKTLHVKAQDMPEPVWELHLQVSSERGKGGLLGAEYLIEDLLKEHGVKDLFYITPSQSTKEYAEQSGGFTRSIFLTKRGSTKQMTDVERQKAETFEQLLLNEMPKLESAHSLSR